MRKSIDGKRMEPSSFALRLTIWKNSLATVETALTELLGLQPNVRMQFRFSSVSSMFCWLSFVLSLAPRSGGVKLARQQSKIPMTYTPGLVPSVRSYYSKGKKTWVGLAAVLHTILVKFCMIPCPA